MANEKRRMIVTLTYEAEYNGEVELDEIQDRLTAGADIKRQIPLTVYAYDREDFATMYHLELRQAQTSIESRTMITTMIDKEE